MLLLLRGDSDVGVLMSLIVALCILVIALRAWYLRAETRDDHPQKKRFRAFRFYWSSRSAGGPDYLPRFVAILIAVVIGLTIWLLSQ